jgi:hypothetical protein
VEDARMLAGEDRAGFEGAVLRDGRYWRRLLPGGDLTGVPPLLVVFGNAVEIAGGLAIETAVGVRLNPVGDDPQNQIAGQVRRRGRPKQFAPADSELVKV